MNLTDEDANQIGELVAGMISVAFTDGVAALTEAIVLNLDHTLVANFLDLKKAKCRKDMATVLMAKFGEVT